MPRPRHASPVPKPPGRYHHGDLRRALLDTALRVVEAQGVDALSLRDLARKLGVSHAAPDHHFPDRLSLLVALAIEGFDRLAVAMEAAASAVPPGPGRLAAVGEAYLRFALDHPSHTQIMYGREVGGMTVRPPELRVAADRSGRILEEAIEDIAGLPRRAPGTPRHPFVELHRLTAWALAHGAARLWIDGPMRASLERHGGGRAQFEARAGAAIALMTQAVARAASERRSGER